MKRVNFRLTEIAYDQLKQLAASRGESMNAAVQYAVQSAVQSDVQNSTQKTAKNDAESDIDWQALYFEEKQRADKQSARLLSLSEKVADSLQASQVLQAMDKPALESTEQKSERVKKHWWNFWS
jgi:hypothetical protein